MDMYDDDFEEDATRFMKDLNLFEVPSHECFSPNSTTLKKSETSAGEEFEKKRELYANLNLEPHSVAHATRVDPNLNPESYYGKIRSKQVSGVQHNYLPDIFSDRSGKSPIDSRSVHVSSAFLSSLKQNDALGQTNRSVGAIESFVKTGTGLKTKDPPAYSKIDRASVIAAAKFPTPKQPLPVTVSNSAITSNGLSNKGYNLSNSNCHITKPSLLHVNDRNQLKYVNVQNKNILSSISSITNRLGHDSLHSSPRSSLSSSSGSRESQNSGSPRTSYTGPIYENLNTVRSTVIPDTIPKINSSLSHDILHVSRPSSSLDTRSPNACIGVVPKPPPPYPYPKVTAEQPIYANLQELSVKPQVPTAVSANNIYNIGVTSTVQRSVPSSSYPYVCTGPQRSVSSISHISGIKDYPLISAGYSCQPVTSANIYQVSSGSTQHCQQSTAPINNIVYSSQAKHPSHSNLGNYISNSSTNLSLRQVNNANSFTPIHSQQLSHQSVNSSMLGSTHSLISNQNYIKPLPNGNHPSDQMSLLKKMQLPQPAHSQILTSSMTTKSVTAGHLPPPPPYPGTGFKPNTLNTKTLLPYNVTPPRQKGPTEAEKKIEAWTKQIEDEMESNPEGEFFGICHTCGEKVTGAGQACQAMGNLYHTNCFICCSCGQ